MNRIRFIACLGLLLTAAVPAAAQVAPPPPGFTPADEGETPPSASGFLQNHGLLKPPRLLSRQIDAVSAEDQSYFSGSPPPLPNSDGAPEPEWSRYDRPPPQPVVVEQTPVVLDAPRFWLRAEALYWWTKSSPLPVPLVTSGSAADAVPGALGQPGTSVLIGDENIGISGRGGGRFTLGFALDNDANWGLEGSYLFLANTTTSEHISSDGGPGSGILAFPFYNPNTASEDATYIAIPDYFAGTAVVRLQDFFQGAEANLLYNLSNTLPGWRFDGLGGFRYVNLRESLTFTTSSPNVYPNPPDYFHTFDQFNAQNNFYGGQFGARASYDNARIYFNGTAKLALGGMVESINANGSTTTDRFSALGAYITQPTNIGTLSQTRFAVIPEVNLNFGLHLSPWASVFVGYSFLYVSSVARPGDQIDRVINPTQAPAISGTYPGNLNGPARPALMNHDTDFWVQGLNFGLQLQF